MTESTRPQEEKFASLLPRGSAESDRPTAAANARAGTFSRGSRSPTTCSSEEKIRDE
jgi:hypothetical protein